MEGRIKLHSNHSRGSLCKIFTSSFSCNKHSSQLLRTCDNKLAVLYLSLVLLSGIIVVMVLNISGNQSRFSGSTKVWIFWERPTYIINSLKMNLKGRIRFGVRCSPNKCSPPNAPRKMLSKKCSPKQNAPQNKMLLGKKCSPSKCSPSKCSQKMLPKKNAT